MIVEESIQTKNDILTEYYNKTVAYDRVLEGNLLLWTEYLDNCLKDYVVRYNFNFFEVANRFHEFISFPYKYDFSEEECRFHWSFIHSARALNLKIDNEFYAQLKKFHKDFHKKPKIKNEYTDVVDILDEQIANEKEIEAKDQKKDTKFMNQELSALKKEIPEEDDLMKRILDMNERNRVENLERERNKEKDITTLENIETGINYIEHTNNEKEVLFL